MQESIILNELSFKAILSSGAGGQHVNKTASKVEVTFNLLNSEGLSETEKQRLQEKLASKITQEGNIVLQCGTSRSQHRNKTTVIKRLLDLLKKNIIVPKKRKKTKPTKSAIEKRLKQKKNTALKKANRKPPKID
ncbi:alternative ribosome rescue aminoacyl-tRNA hydrolase ArfB [Patiriisocius hiemis]|uniref:Alternative ribosome rescue aminoacyl-tRNA hydrolase ArfB n=1 Tax=Patiriisocius hiemis TaxID=3075604 RepID=A0ABU2YE15_9FLAO|nr:alternative ribosome rescue aminoacyl-tRNA hydrolase ArfB [Constantimarinum sp. W242]MDT0556426.1 alternative ribosome rescue aminoacyl-tRNA hydrolase ArfB [Constantimarinum sp. W242]